MAQTGSGKRPKLFVGRSDRLIARLKAMLYAWRFIDQVDGQLFMLWTKLPERYGSEQEGYSPSNIFDLTKFYQDGGAEDLVFIDNADKYPTDAIALDAPEFKGCMASGFDRSRFEGSDDCFIRRGSGRYFFADEPRSHEHMQSRVKSLFDRLPLNPRIATAFEHFQKHAGVSPGEYGAIHVRRGDVYDMLRNELPAYGAKNEPLGDQRFDLLVQHFIVRTAPFEFYRPYVEEMIANGQKIVFTSDTPSTIKDYQKAYGPKHFIDLSKYDMRVVIQKAFLDFTVLRHASRIIGTSSNFSHFAAEIGSGKFENAAGQGTIDIARAEFEQEILTSKDMGKKVKREAVERLEKQFSAFAARIAAR